VLEYALKFIKLSHFTPAYIENERLKMNRFGTGLNPRVKEKMAVRHYGSYKDIYNASGQCGKGDQGEERVLQ